MNMKSFVIAHFVFLIGFQFSLYGQDDFVIRKGSDSYYFKGQLEKCFLKEEEYLIKGFLMLNGH